MARLVVLISGGGSNLEALLKSLPVSGISAEVVAVGSDHNAPGLENASKRSLPTFVVPLAGATSRESWGESLSQAIGQWDPDWIILSGFMKLLPPGMVRHYRHKIINTHPAYLPEFPGAHAVQDALAARVSETGASVILVDEGVDSGPILARERVPIVPGDTETTLHERIKVVERRLLLEVLESLLSPVTTKTEGREHE